MLVQIDFMFILGNDYWGKKQPPFTYSFAWNLSMLPMSEISPFGSTMNAIVGLAIIVDKQLGEASIMPPTLQKFLRYSCQLW